MNRRRHTSDKTGQPIYNPPLILFNVRHLSYSRQYTFNRFVAIWIFGY